jgi:spermidine/putrescine transport system permease protein
VTLPLSAPGLAAGVLLVFIPALGQFIVSDMLGGAKSALIGNVVQSQFAASSGVGDKPFGAAVAFELVAAVLLMLFLYGLYARRRHGGELL